ncbi:MAG: hypothetical protein E7K04_03205 [Helicobacter sp.]|nr:hypothetical protein [Helicobacter sp.]
MKYNLANRGFALAEVLFGLIILGIVSISFFKLALNVKKQERDILIFTKNNLDINNALLRISHALDEISLDELNLYDFSANGSRFHIFLQNDKLFLNNELLASEIKSFEISILSDNAASSSKIRSKNLLIKACTKRFCAQKVVLLYA